ncbi:MAG: proton-conducting membrane transporter, partial [Mesorhizobium sp.]
ADNLRRLIGIGPVNEKLLKGLGVTSYAQIAAWTAADVKRIEDVLNFDGRIAREQWIEQAKLLAAGDEKEFARRFPTAGTASNT